MYSVSPEGEGEKRDKSFSRERERGRERRGMWGRGKKKTVGVCLSSVSKFPF